MRIPKPASRGIAGSAGSSPTHYASTLALGAVLIAACTVTAQAQLIEQYFPNDLPGYSPDLTASVLNRMYYQQTSPGVALGDFVIRPELTENTGYNSNTLGKPDSGSAEVESIAGVQANSDWGRDSANLSFGVDDRRYLAVPSASYTNWAVNAGGSIDLGNDRLSVAYSHLALNLAATDLGVIGITTPVPYSVDDGSLAYLKEFGRFSLTPAFEFANFVFGQSGGVTKVNYNSLDHYAELESLVGRYENAPGDAAVVVVRFSQAQFSVIPGDDYFDSAGFAGLDFRGNSIIQLRALAGVERRSFSDRSAKTLTIPSFQITALWSPTELDTMTATGTRRIDDPTSPFALDASILDGRLELDHELRSDVFLSGFAEIEQSRSELANSVLGSDTQSQMSLGTSAVWDISSHFRATLGYGYNVTSTQSNSALPNAARTGYPNFNSQTTLIGITVFE